MVVCTHLSPSSTAPPTTLTIARTKRRDGKRAHCDHSPFASDDCEDNSCLGLPYALAVSQQIPAGAGKTGHLGGPVTEMTSEAAGMVDGPPEMFCES